MWAGPELPQFAKHLPGTKELREQIEIIAVAFGWLLAVGKTCIEYTHSRLSIASRRTKELHRAGELVGRISLRDIDFAARCSVLGITFHPYRLGQGLGTDALHALLHHYFDTMGMQTLFLDVAAFNRRAHRCYEKCGFHTTGHHWGEPQPDYAGVMYRREYAGIRHLFRSQGGFIRPLLIDMVLRREQFLRPEAL